MISTMQVLNEASGKKKVAFKITQTECILYIFSRLNRLVFPCSFFDVCYQPTQCIHVLTYQGVAAPLEDILRSTVMFGVKAPAALALKTKQLVDAALGSSSSCPRNGRETLKVLVCMMVDSRCSTNFFVLSLNSSNHH